jgi:hypothetical protein
MTQQRDIERLLDLWLSDGPTESSDRVIDVVADRIERQPQRPAWRFHPREIHVNTMLRAGAAVAAVVVVAFIAFELLPARSVVVGGPGPSPSASVTTPPSSLPSPSGSYLAAGCANTGQDCASPFPAGPVTSKVFTPTVSFTSPAGYIGFDDTAQTYGVRTAPGSTPGGFYIFRDPALSTQANDCAGNPDTGVGPYTVNSISSAIGADARFQVTTPAAVTIGRYTGKTFDLQLRSTWTGTCPWSNGQPAAMVLTVQNGLSSTSPSYGMGHGDLPLRVYLLNVGHSVIWIQVDLNTADQGLSVLRTLSFAP